MSNLLNPSALRRLKFVELLFFEEGWTTVDAIAKTIHYSSRILRTDISIINEQYHPFYIEVSTKKGIKLYAPANFSIDYIYYLTLKNSPEFNLLSAIFFNEDLTITDLIQSLYLSTSTIQRMVVRLNEHMEKYDVIIDGPTFAITGNELNIRHFYSYYLSERYLPYETFDSNVTEEHIQSLDQLLAHVTPDFKDIIHFPSATVTRSFMFTSIIRYKHGHLLPKSTPNQFFLPIIKKIMTDIELNKLFQKLYGVELSEPLLYEMFAPLTKKHFAINNDHLYRILLYEDPVIKETIDLLTNYFDNVRDVLDIELPNKDELIYKLYNINNILLQQDYILHDKNAFFINRIKQEHPLLVCTLKEAINHLQFVEHFGWSEADVNRFLYTILVYWPDLIGLLHKSYAPIKIGLFCNLGIQHTHYLKQALQNRFGSYIQIELFAEKSLAAVIEKAKTFDITLTNVSGIQFEETFSICISPIPSEKNWQMIHQELLRLSTERFYCTKLLHQNIPSLS